MRSALVALLLIIAMSPTAAPSKVELSPEPARPSKVDTTAPLSKNEAAALSPNKPEAEPARPSRTETASPSPGKSDTESVSLTESASQRVEGVFIGAQPSAQYSRKPEDIIELTNGDLLVSVRAPAGLTTIITPVGNIVVAPNCDVVVGFFERSLLVQNLHGTADGVTIRLEKSFFDEAVNEAIVVPPGQELLAVAKSHNSAPLPGTISSEESFKEALKVASRHRHHVGVGLADVAVTEPAGLAASANLLNTISQAQKNNEETEFFKELRTAAALTPYWKWDQQARPSSDANQSSPAKIESNAAGATGSQK